jgi:hypothetical protein
MILKNITNCKQFKVIDERSEQTKIITATIIIIVTNQSDSF